MYLTLLTIHSWLRWLVLLAALWAIFRSLSGWFGKKTYSKADNQAAIFFTSFIDLQFLLGLVLYYFYSPYTLQAFKNFGAAMKNSNLRFWAIEHITMMVLAIVFVHIARSSSKKASTDLKKHRRMAIYSLIALILMLTAIPWNEAARLFRM